MGASFGEAVADEGSNRWVGNGRGRAVARADDASREAASRLGPCERAHSAREQRPQERTQ